MAGKISTLAGRTVSEELKVDSENKMWTSVISAANIGVFNGRRVDEVIAGNDVSKKAKNIAEKHKVNNFSL